MTDIAYIRHHAGDIEVCVVSNGDFRSASISKEHAVKMAWQLINAANEVKDEEERQRVDTITERE